MHIFGIPRVHRALLCIWFPWEPPVISLHLVKTCSGGMDHPSFLQPANPPSIGLSEVYPCRDTLLVGEHVSDFIPCRLLWGSEALTMDQELKLMKGDLPLRQQFVDWTSVQNLSTIPFPYTNLLGDRVVLGLIGFCLVISQHCHGRWCYRANLASELWLPLCGGAQRHWTLGSFPNIMESGRGRDFSWKAREERVNNDHVRASARARFQDTCMHRIERHLPVVAIGRYGLPLRSSPSPFSW